MKIDAELEAQMIAAGAVVKYHGRSIDQMPEVKPKPKKVKKVNLIEPAINVGFNFVQFTLPLKLESASTNRGAFNKAHLRYPAQYRWVWFSHFAPQFHETSFPFWAIAAEKPIYVTITRIGREMDDDNLRTAAKPLRDAIALGFGLKDDPKGPLKWQYDQKPRMVYGAIVRLSLEA